MITRHTPGPWSLKSDPFHFDTLSSIVGGATKGGGTRFPSHELHVEIGGFADFRIQEANSRLIAAAPELLEAVIYQLDLNKWLESADAEAPFFEETLRLRLNTASDYMTAAIAKATGEDAP